MGLKYSNKQNNNYRTFVIVSKSIQHDHEHQIKKIIFWLNITMDDFWFVVNS
jgi:hypothetical protein